MRRDPTAFRERFNAYKNGEMPYENGLPKYANGTPNIVDMLDNELLDTLHYINDYFSNLGMSTIDIAGIAANMFKESSFRHNAKDSAGYHGYVQMSPDMQLAVKAAYGNLDPDTQLLFVYDQLTGNSKVKGYTNGAGYLYGLYKTGGDAAEAFRSTFERNKAGRQQSRIDYGNLIYDYLANRAVESAIKKEVGEQPIPIVARPDATVVKKIVPKAKTRARWTGADNVSPYLTGKPMVKLLKEVKLPNIIEENKKTLWKAPMGFKNGKLPGYQTGNTPITTTGGAPVIVPVTTVPDDPGADDVKEVLERVAGFLPYIGTILDWLAVADGNYNKVPSAIVGTVADAFLPGLKSAYKAYKSYNILSKTAPKIVDKIVYGKKAAKAGQKLSANGAYQAVGTYQDVLDDQGYMSKHKNGKLPLFEDGTSGVLMVLHPISSIRKRLYDHVFPYGYNNAAERAFSALAKNKPHISENYGKWNYRGDEQRLDDLWGTYLQIPDSQRHYPRVLTKSKYSPTISKDGGAVYYSVPLSNEEKHHIVNHALWYGNDKNAPKLLNPDFGNFTVGRGRDSNGDYASWYDTWDLNPARGISNIGGNIAKKLGLDKIEDLSFGVGKPFSLYDRIYLDDYYGVKGNNRGGIYLPEITVRGRNKKIELEEEESQSSGEYNNGELPEYKNGKSSIHINPANRGKFNATKKRTGKTTEELAHSSNPLTRKRAIFALNARKWKH